jgi:cytochrome c-type biogenesis protein CcmH
MRTLLAIVLLGLVLANAQAIVESKDVMPSDFDSHAQKERYKHLIKDLRCTVCQNQNLADSHAELAKDLRVQVLQMMKQGKSDDEIKDYLVQRYSEFVLYNPRFEPTTYILWIGPFVALLAAVVILLIVIKRRQQARASFDEADREALAAALRNVEHNPDSDKNK